MNTVNLFTKIEALPPDLKKEALAFIEKLIQKNKKNKPESLAGFGSLKGKIHLSDDFDEPLDDFKEYM
jgi:hypothetical protein